MASENLVVGLALAVVVLAVILFGVVIVALAAPALPIPAAHLTTSPTASGQSSRRRVRCRGPTQRARPSLPGGGASSSRKARPVPRPPLTLNPRSERPPSGPEPGRPHGG